MDLISGGASAIAVIVVIVILVALVAFIASRVRRVPPNQALVIVGRNAEKSESGAGFSSPQKVIIGGRTFIWPIFQEGFTLSLEQYQTSVTAEARDANFINTAVVATVNFKVTGTEDGVRRAVQRYLLQQDALPEIVRQSLEGAIRGLIGDRPVDELVKSFSVVAQEAVNQTKNDLAELGLQIETLNVREITTPGSSYLDDRARSNAARARQVAEVAEAENKRISALAAIENDQQTAERQLELDLRRAAIKADTDRANATALAAGELAKAEQDRLVADQERTAVAAQAEVSKERLRIDVELPAEARKYATVQDAQAARDAEKAKVDVEVYQRTQNAEAAKTAAVNEAASITALGKANRRRDPGPRPGGGPGGRRARRGAEQAVARGPAGAHHRVHAGDRARDGGAARERGQHDDHLGGRRQRAQPLGGREHGDAAEAAEGHHGHRRRHGAELVPRLDGRGHVRRRIRVRCDRHGRGPEDGRVRGRRDLIPVPVPVGTRGVPTGPV
ncbi:flotillin [Clavibacter sp. B3I6]|nr:flotillin [Clavibacter sp. B3I6]